MSWNSLILINLNLKWRSDLVTSCIRAWFSSFIFFYPDKQLSGWKGRESVEPQPYNVFSLEHLTSNLPPIPNPFKTKKRNVQEVLLAQMEKKNCVHNFCAEVSNRRWSMGEPVEELKLQH
jgi:hypothetical protein